MGVITDTGARSVGCVKGERAWRAAKPDLAQTICGLLGLGWLARWKVTPP